MKSSTRGRSFIKQRRERKPPIGSPRDWIHHAEADLAMARLAVGDQNILASLICFHCQQAAEKALKSVFVARKIRFPFIHDLEQLMDLLRAHGVMVPRNISDVDWLTPFATKARYPGGRKEPSAEGRVQEAIRLADRIYAWCGRMIGRSRKTK